MKVFGLILLRARKVLFGAGVLFAIGAYAWWWTMGVGAFYLPEMSI